LSQRIDHITFLQCGYRMKQTLGQNSVEELVSPYVDISRFCPTFNL